MSAKKCFPKDDMRLARSLLLLNFRAIAGCWVLSDKDMTLGLGRRDHLSDARKIF